MAFCIGCSAGDHEYEDCPYREAVAALRRQGVDITTAQARRMDEAARGDRT